MAKKRKNQSLSTRQILLSIVALIITVGAAYFGIELDETGTDDTADTNNNPVPAVVPVEGEWYNLYFTNVINSDDEGDHQGAAVEDALIAAIDGAQNTIDAALYELNAPGVTQALIRALERDVTVRMVADDDHAFEDPTSTVEDLVAAGEAANNPLEIVSDERGAFMHNKFFIIDNRYVWTGSMNITRNGIYNNNNHAILIESPELAANYQTEFDEMFLEGFFTRRGDPGNAPNPLLQFGDSLVETFFSPEQGEEIEDRMVELVNNAEESVYIMTMVLTSDELGEALVAQENAGIEIRGVFDSLQARTDASEFDPLACAGADLRVDGNPNILHHKVLIIDEETVVMGSYNISDSARDNNSENVLIVTDPGVAAAFMQEFENNFSIGSAPDDLECS